jgi:hypothetical protein
MERRGGVASGTVRTFVSGGIGACEMSDDRDRDQANLQVTHWSEANASDQAAVPASELPVAGGASDFSAVLPVGFTRSRSSLLGLK